MPIDSPSIIFASFVVTAVVSLFTWAYALGPKSTPWRQDWAWANTSLVAGVGLLLTEGQVSPWISVISANLLVLVGYAFLEIGLRQFAGRGKSWVVTVTSFAGVLVGYVVFTFVWDSIPARALLHSAFAAVVMSQIAWLLITALPDERREHPKLIGAFAALFVILPVFYTVRLVMTFTENSASVLDNNLMTAGLFLGVTTSMVAWTLGFVSLDTFRGQRLLEQTLATRDRLFSLLAHDLRGPVGSLAIILESSLDPATPREELDLAVRHASKAARASSDLVENLLSWSRSQKGQLTLQRRSLPLGRLLEAAIAPLETLALAKGVALTVRAQPELEMLADEPTLLAVVRNLVSNALKFTPKGGEVHVVGRQEGPNTVIRVTDTGQGISNEVLERIKGGQLPGSQPGTDGEQGTGLGLALCREFVRANGGTLTWEPVRGTSPRGTAATVSLPH